MAELDQITVSTRRFIARARRKLVDNIFQVSPFMAYMKANLKEDFTGGRLIQENFLYDTLIGGPYAKGGTFNITQKQIEQAGQFVPKFFYTNISLYKEDIQVLNKGTDTQIFDIVQSRTETAYQNIGAQLAIGAYNEGQGGLAAYWVNNLNGLAEALNDGTTGTVSWNGQHYATYGTITRGGAVAAALNSVPVNVGGVIDYPQLEEQYGNATFGAIEPNLILTTVLGYSFLKEKFQAQQRYESVTDLNLGITAMKFNGASILKDRYCPGTYLATNTSRPDPVVNAFMDNISGVAGTAYPTQTGTGEAMFILNARKPFINFYVSDDPEFGFGFTGFKPAQDNNTIAGQILFAGNMTVPGPRYHVQMYGITG
jgi:hypothetical protein